MQTRKQDGNAQEKKTLHKTPHHYVAVSTCILYLNVERATQLYLCPNKYTSIVDDIKKI